MSKKGAMRFVDALEAAENRKVAVRPSTEGFANGTGELALSSF